MKKNKFNPELLKSEISRFRLLENYDFYHEDKKSPEFNTIEEDDEDAQTDVDVDIDKNVDSQSSDGVPSVDDGGDDMSNAENDIENELGISDDSGDAPIGDMPEPTAEEVPIEEPVDDGIEIDVTSLVNGTEEAKSSADRAVQNSELMLQQLADLEKRISGMSVLNDKIDSIEHQIIKRLPTPVEKLEMRSMDSYPYNQKLTDYWSEKEGPQEVKPKEYVLTQDDVDNSYSESEIKNSFNDDYEEEDIY